MQWPPRHPFCRGFDAATSGDASDLDLDGYAEIPVVDADGPARRGFFRLADDRSGFVLAGAYRDVTPPTDEDALGLLGDVNGDGFMDYATRYGRTLYMGDRMGPTPAALVPLQPMVGRGPVGFVPAGDLNGDGFDDFVARLQYPDISMGIGVYFGSADLRALVTPDLEARCLPTAWHAATPSFDWGMRVKDFANDGRRSLVVGGQRTNARVFDLPLTQPMRTELGELFHIPNIAMDSAGSFFASRGAWRTSRHGARCSLPQRPARAAGR